MDFFGLGLMDIGIRLILGVFIGFCIGMTGVGGGVLVLPSLTLALGMDAVKAVGTASLYAFLTKVYATYHHARLKTIDWSICTFFLLGALPANIGVSTWISNQGADQEFNKNLKMFIVGVVFFSIIMMILNLISKMRSEKSSQKDDRASLATKLKKHASIRKMLGVIMGVVIGGLIGATSIGGGVLIVPMLMILFGLVASRTVGSSIFIAVVLTLVTALIYSSGGQTAIPTAITMAGGSLLGVYYGSKLAVKVPEKLLQSLVIGVVFIAAILMLIGNGGH